MEGDSHGEMSNGDVLCSVSGALWLSRLNGPVEGGPLSFGEINIAREGSGGQPGGEGGGLSEGGGLPTTTTHTYVVIKRGIKKNPSTSQ